MLRTKECFVCYYERLQGLSEYREDMDSVSTYLSSRARLDPVEDAEKKDIKIKKWTDALTKPSLDYTDLFPEIVNNSVGQVWIRRENPKLNATTSFEKNSAFIILYHRKKKS